MAENNERNRITDDEELFRIEYESPYGDSNISRPDVSPAVVKRLPRYFRYLRELIRMGKTRVSSAELSRMMNVTASQIRQDLFDISVYTESVDQILFQVHPSLDECLDLYFIKLFHHAVHGSGNRRV